MHVVHHNTLSDSFRRRIVWFLPKQDSDRIRISFFKNRIGSDCEYPLSDHLCHAVALIFLKGNTFFDSGVKRNSDAKFLTLQSHHVHISGVRIWKFCNPAPFRYFFINSMSNPYPKILNYGLWYPMQIRNRSINCTSANIIGIVYFASWGKNCGYFASCQTKVVEVVTWKVGYDTQKTRAKVWDWGKC